MRDAEGSSLRGERGWGDLAPWTNISVHVLTGVTVDKVKGATRVTNLDLSGCECGSGATQE